MSRDSYGELMEKKRLAVAQEQLETRQSNARQRKFNAACERYREIRREYDRLSNLADAAFIRWFEKRARGEPTNGARAVALANRVNEVSGRLYSAEGDVYLAADDRGFMDVDFDEIYEQRRG